MSDRTPHARGIQTPASPEAEMGVLSALMRDPRQVGALCAESRVSEETFYHSGHWTIYRTITEMVDQGKPVDMVSLMQVLHDRGELDRCGGAQKLSDLAHYMPTTGMAEFHLGILREKETLRKIARLGAEFQKRAYEEPDNAAGLLAELETAALAIGGLAHDPEVDFRTHLMRAMDRLQGRIERKTGMIGLPTGLNALDKLTGGLAAPDMIVIAAETSGGKTALATRFIEAAAVDSGETVAVFSYEMGNDEVTDRIVASYSRLNLLKYRQGWISEVEFGNLMARASALKEAKVVLVDDGDLNIAQVRARARRIKQRRGLSLIVIDYAQLVPATSGKKDANREQEVAHVSRQCKAMAKELGVPVVVLSQLNDDGKTRESRALAQDANMLLLIQEETDDSGNSRHYIRIAKQRNGPRDRVPVTFLKEFARFEDYSGAPEPEQETRSESPKKEKKKWWA